MSTMPQTELPKPVALRGPHSRFPAAEQSGPEPAFGAASGLRIDRPAMVNRLVSLLLVDSDETVVDRLLRMIEDRFGPAARTQVARTAGEALEVLARQPIDVVLTEYQLPDADGLGLIASIAARHPGVATILLTAHGSESIAAGSLKFGARDYLAKREIDAAALHRSIAQAFQKASADREQARRIAQLERSQSEMDQVVRSLSHDMSAMFMLLDHSIQRLKDATDPADKSGARATRCGGGANIQATAASEQSVELRPLAQQFTHVEACLRESKRFLDDLTTIARTGHVQMEPSCVELDQSVAEVLFEQRELLAERNVQVNVAPGLPAVWCNPFRVKQVITNLVRNAARHGCGASEPRISIGPWPSPDPAETGFAWLSIHDNGPGIPCNSREVIFEPGRRLAGAHADGSGMGLSIVRKIVQHYGGEVFVAPTEEGATFVFSLPFAADDVATS